MREWRADPAAQPTGITQPTVHPSGTWCCSAGSEGDASSASPAVVQRLLCPRCLCCSARSRIRPPMAVTPALAQPGSRRDVCGSGPGWPRGSAALQHLGRAGALWAAGALPCPACRCPPPPALPAAQPLNHIASRVVGLGLINIHSCFQV